MSDVRNQLKRPEDKKEEAKPGSDDSKTNSRKLKFGKWFLAAAGTAAVAFGIACGDASKDIYYPACPPCSETCEDGGQETDSDMDAGPDTDVDADTDSGGPTDAGPDTDSGDLDSGPDTDTDSGLTDAGPDTDADTDSGDPTDAGPDTDSGDLDSGPDTDSGPSCSGVFDEVVTEEIFDKEVGREVGGYMITYVSQTSGGATIDIGCAPGTDDILSGESLGMESEQSYEIASDAKRIRITLHSRNTWDATMSVTVESL